MSDQQKEKPKRPRKVKRDANGKMIVEYKNDRLLKPKKHDEEWRAKKLAEYEKQHQMELEKGKGSMLGYFSPARSAALGDSFVESAKITAKLARGKGPQLRGGAKPSRTPKTTFGKFTTTAVGDPYMSPGQIRMKWIKEQKKKFIQPQAMRSGAYNKKTILTKTFSRQRFLSNIDGDEDVSALKQKIKRAKETMASPAPKFDGFKGPNFYTNPVKKGGPGMNGTLLPVYGDNKTLKDLRKYVESPYESLRETELARMKASEDKIKQIHGDNPKAFCGMVSKKGVPTFSKDVELYGEDKKATAMIKAKAAKEEAARKAAAEAAAAEEEKPPEWRPSNPPKKMVYADKKSYFGGSVHEYVADPVPEFQAGAKLKKSEDETEPLNPSWVPSGAHSHGHKGTASVCLNPAQLRHQIFVKTSVTATSRTTTR